MQNKYIRFYLQLDRMPTMSHKEFKDLNWLPVICRLTNALFQSRLNLSMTCSFYLNEIFEFAPQGKISLRNNFLELKLSFRNTNTVQKALSFIDPLFWNQIPEILKKTNNLNTFTHNLKKRIFNQMT